MPRQHSSSTKKRGRPVGREHGDRLGLRLPADLRQSLERWIAAQPDPKPTRSEAIRRLMELGLTVRSDEDDAPKPHGDKLAVPAGRAAGHRRKVMLGEPEEPDEQ